MPLAPLDDAAWDKLVIFWQDQPWQSPGKTTVKCRRVIGWDKKAAQGQKGASSERKGEPLKTWTSTHQLTDQVKMVDGVAIPNDFEQWDVWEFLLARSYDEDKPKALSVFHPELYRQGVEAASVEEIGSMVRDGVGGATIEVKWLEFRPPTPTGGGGSGGAVDPDDEPDGRTETDDAIDKALAEIDALQKEGEAL